MLFLSQAVINSTITPNMTFTQTSQKFGQWSDVRANTVYGLGFASEAELGKFIEKFHEVKEATKNAMAKASTNGSSAVTPVTSANASPVTSRSSITQNDSFVSDIADPPLSATGSIVSHLNVVSRTFFSKPIRFALEVGESAAHVGGEQQQHDSQRSQDGLEHLLHRRHHRRLRTPAQVRERAAKVGIGSKVCERTGLCPTYR